MKERNSMITGCSDGVRPVIFKVEIYDDGTRPNRTSVWANRSDAQRRDSVRAQRRLNR